MAPDRTLYRPGPVPIEDRKPLFMLLEIWLDLTMVPALRAAVDYDFEQAAKATSHGEMRGNA